MAFKSGRPRPTPTPRSIFRRDRVFFMVYSRSFVAEEIALNDPVNDVAKSVTGVVCFVQNFFDLLAIRETDRGARGVCGKLTDKISSHRSLIVIQQQSLEFSNVFKTAAVRKRARGIHGQRVVEGEGLT